MAFLPYIKQSFKEVLELADYPASNIKKGSFQALSQFCLCLNVAQAQSPEAAEGKQVLTLSQYQVN